MNENVSKTFGYSLILIAAVILPFLFPAILTQMTFLWLMIIFALSWDILGGQMGYNSFGNIIFFGFGCYIGALLQKFTDWNYFFTLFLAMGLSAIFSVIVALLIGRWILMMRGHYFAICTLGLSIAIADFISAWEFVGGSAGIATEVFPGSADGAKMFYYYLLFILAAGTFLTLRFLHKTRFFRGLNAIRDNEDKAEALGVHTTRYKEFAWVLSALFLSLTGAPMGNVVGFIHPRDLAFAGPTFGVYMILMAILGGKGTLWGPVIGAVVFHVSQELLWTYLFGWQRVALGLLIVIIIVFFPLGILGYFGKERKKPVAARD